MSGLVMMQGESPFEGEPTVDLVLESVWSTAQHVLKKHGEHGAMFLLFCADSCIAIDAAGAWRPETKEKIAGIVSELVKKHDALVVAFAAEAYLHEDGPGESRIGREAGRVEVLNLDVESRSENAMRFAKVTRREGVMEIGAPKTIRNVNKKGICTRWFATGSIQ